MKSPSVLSLLAAIVILSGTALADTFLQGLAGVDGLQNEGSQGASARNDRFYVGPDKAFIGEPYDWSGVGRSSFLGAWATMISPTYFVSSSHYHPTSTLSETITFRTGNSESSPSYTYTVDSFGYETSSAGLGGNYPKSDLYLGRLTAPVDASIAKYPVEVLPNIAAYIGQTIWTYGYGNTTLSINGNADYRPRVGKNNIDSISVLDGVYPPLAPETTMVMYYGYNATGGQGPDECYLEQFDSGGPAFTVVDGSLALLGTGFVNAEDLQLSSTVYDGAPSGSAFVPYYVADLNANMTGGEQVMVVVPEPSAWLLLGMAAATLLCCWQRRKRPVC